ncbi:fimbrial protein [Stenotrophomonas maltophilia]|uniref:Fimbrial protein n=1 Tax=Stenotrophomonas maltophilia TaxID=40324 RepID=A0AA40YGD1_STEMA|nr:MULTISPECIES: CS1 type fimbrial major subunit [Stenotrophomonas]KOO86340.1 fimbrial protein [Stenotrophomonas maltophilia]KUO98129.1 fimbrial protein [Stenotrophomonas maltophilia]MBH1585699.1 fimbrial protein [Stenotrophomonas maltophilia]MBH1791370.1 fimbrial protein [Stenotrophomonas maltophilia]MCR1818048.1 fimbrial protein [Stenotrophomonas muris]
MHAIIKKAALAAALATASLSAHALETKITVYADVDPTLALLRDDGTPLPDTVQLTHDPLRGLLPSTQQVRIHSNDETADIQVRLRQTPELLNGSTRVPLAVSLNSDALTTSVTELKAADLFNGASSTPGASIPMPLTIAQGGAGGPLTVNGRYEGVVFIVMNQKP